MGRGVVLCSLRPYLKLVFGKVNLNSCCVPIFQSLASTVAEMNRGPNFLGMLPWPRPLPILVLNVVFGKLVQGLKLCVFLTQSVQLTLSSVQLTLLECVMWSSKMSWNRWKNEQICTVKFQNFLGAVPPDPHTGEGLRRPSPGSTPLGTPALRASVPRSGPSAPPSSLSVCSWHFEIF